MAPYVAQVPFQVRCIRGNPAALLEEGTIYIVAVIVEEGYDHRGHLQKPGYILKPYIGINERVGKYSVTYPYVWDTDRFEIV